MQMPSTSRNVHVLQRDQSCCASSLDAHPSPRCTCPSLAVIPLVESPQTNLEIPHAAAGDVRTRTHQTPPIPKSDSNPIGPASAANAGGFLQVAVSKANRRGHIKPLAMHVSRRFTSDTALGLLGTDLPRG